MVTSCCVPECNQKGKKTPTGEKVSFFEFPMHSYEEKTTASNRNTEPNDTCSELNVPKKIEELEEEVLKLRQENTELKKKLDEVEKQNEAISARLFSLERLHQTLTSTFILVFQIMLLSSPYLTF